MRARAKQEHREGIEPVTVSNADKQKAWRNRRKEKVDQANTSLDAAEDLIGQMMKVTKSPDHLRDLFALTELMRSVRKGLK